MADLNSNINMMLSSPKGAGAPTGALGNKGSIFA